MRLLNQVDGLFLRIGLSINNSLFIVENTKMTLKIKIRILIGVISVVLFIIQSEPSENGIVSDIIDNCHKEYRRSRIKCSPINKAEVGMDENQTITENF